MNFKSINFRKISFILFIFSTLSLASYFVYIKYIKTDMVNDVKLRLAQALDNMDPGYYTLESANYLKELGKIILMGGDHAKAIDFYNFSLTVYKKLDEYNITASSSNIADLYNMIAWLNLNIGNHKNALSNYISALELVRQLQGNDYNEAVASTFNNIGVCYENLKGKSKKALKYFNKALKIYRWLGYKNGLDKSRNITETNIKRVTEQIEKTKNNTKKT